MKPLADQGLYLVANLLDVYGNEVSIMASFIYYVGRPVSSYHAQKILTHIFDVLGNQFFV
jgi:hypothetical protein